MRLIDADAVVKIITEMEKYNNGKTDCAFKEGYACGLDYALETLAGAPTIDAVEVVHASWEAVELYCNHAKEFRCSGEDGCGAVIEYGNYTRSCGYEYCPYCGARMDADDEKKETPRN